MKKIIALLLVLVYMFVWAGCAVQQEYSVKIVIPAGHEGEFIYSEEEISSIKGRVEIKSIDLSEDAEFRLTPVDIAEAKPYECTNFPKGQPMLIETEKGTWYTIGVAMSNPTDEDIVVVFHVKNVTVRTE